MCAQGKLPYTCRSLENFFDQKNWFGIDRYLQLTDSLHSNMKHRNIKKIRKKEKDHKSFFYKAFRVIKVVIIIFAFVKFLCWVYVAFPDLKHCAGAVVRSIMTFGVILPFFRQNMDIRLILRWSFKICFCSAYAVAQLIVGKAA